MAFARVNGVVLHHEVRGKAGAPPIVFSNSLGTDFRIWDAVCDRLSDRYRLVLYDKRGHGLSESTPPPYALSDHVEDLAALLDHLGIGRAAVVGLSVGGLIAQGLAALHPDRVAALVLCDTGHKIGTRDSWNARIDAVSAGGIGPIAGNILKLWFTPRYRDPANPDFVGYAAMLTRSDRDGYVGTCAALRDADLTESTRALKVPTLLLVGDQDGSTPPDMVRATAALIEGSEFHVVEEAGHLPNIEKPEAVAALIAGFLASHRYA